MEDTWLVFDFGLFKKQKAKKKKKNQLYIQSQTETTDYGKTYGGTGKKAGPEPIPHSEHGEVLVSSGKSGVAGTQCSLADTAQHQEFTSTDSIPATAKGRPFPQEPAPAPSRTCAIQREGSAPTRFHGCFFSLLASDLNDISEKPFPPLSYSKLEEDRRKHKTKGPQEKSQGGGQNDIRGVQKVLDLVVKWNRGSPRIRRT